VALVEPDAERAAAASARFRAPAVPSIAELPPTVEAATLAAPTTLHGPLGMALLDRGVHVLVEKPIAEDIAVAEALAARAEERGLVLQVGHVERFSTAFEALRAAVTTPLFIECERIAPFSGRSVDVDVVLDLMIHDLDLVAALVGGPIVSIDAVGAPVLTAREDIANARLRFETGCVANITASRISFKTERKLRVFQPDDYLAADLQTRRITRVTRRGDGGALEARVEAAPEGDSLAREIAAFLDCVRAGAAPRVSGRDGVAALSAALAIKRTLREHRETMARRLAEAPR
jgi:predicted dehydrogenase